MKLSVIVPSIGRPGLLPLINSLPGEWVEWVIVFDTARRDKQIDVCARMSELAHAGIDYWCCPVGNDYGQQQRNYGMGKATGDWLAFAQDDQRFTPDAQALLQMVAAGWQSSGDHPVLFRLAKWPNAPDALVWREEGKFERNMVDGDCMVVPNVPARLGEWGTGYDGDWDFLNTTAALWGNQLEWRREVIQRGV